MRLPSLSSTMARKPSAVLLGLAQRIADAAVDHVAGLGLLDLDAEDCAIELDCTRESKTRSGGECISLIGRDHDPPAVAGSAPGEAVDRAASRRSSIDREAALAARIDARAVHALAVERHDDVSAPIDCDEPAIALQVCQLRDDSACGFRERLAQIAHAGRDVASEHAPHKDL